MNRRMQIRPFFFLCIFSVLQFSRLSSSAKCSLLVGKEEKKRGRKGGHFALKPTGPLRDLLLLQLFTPLSPFPLSIFRWASSMRVKTTAKTKKKNLPLATKNFLPLESTLTWFVFFFLPSLRYNSAVKKFLSLLPPVPLFCFMHTSSVKKNEGKRRLKRESGGSK